MLIKNAKICPKLQQHQSRFCVNCKLDHRISRPNAAHMKILQCELKIKIFFCFVALFVGAAFDVNVNRIRRTECEEV